MRRLSISLLIVVLLATIGIGWALDRLFAELEPGAADSLDVYRQLGQTLAKSMDGATTLPAVIDSWQGSGATQLRLLDNNALALPAELKQQLDTGLALTLDSETGVTLYFALPKSQQVLALSPPPDAPNRTPFAFCFNHPVLCRDYLAHTHLAVPFSTTVAGSDDSRKGIWRRSS